MRILSDRRRRTEQNETRLLKNHKRGHNQYGESDDKCVNHLFMVDRVYSI